MINPLNTKHLNGEPRESHTVCPDCQTNKFNTQRISLPNGGQHIRATCSICGRFIKFLPHTPLGFHFGKHRGESVPEVAAKDPSYLKWCLLENVLKGRLRDAVKAVFAGAQR